MATWPADERRSSERFRMRRPVRVEGATGWTRDVNASGMFIEIDKPAVVGATLALSLRLEHADLRGPVDVGCEGTVVRVEQIEEGFGLAVSITSYRGGAADTVEAT